MDYKKTLAIIFIKVDYLKCDCLSELDIAI